MMDYLPLHFDLKSRLCLVVGGGKIALRKAKLLASAGALIKVVAPVIDEGFSELGSLTKLQLESRPFETSDLFEVSLVVVATNDEDLNRKVAEQAEDRHLPVNVVDQPALCSVIFPSIVDRHPVLLSVSSAGKSPTLTRSIREQLESVVPEGVGRLADFLGSMRKVLKERFNDTGARRAFVEVFLKTPEAHQVMEGKTDAAEALIYKSSAEMTQGELSQGEVYLVGAGPGDPDLLTLKALQLMQKADLVLYDNLVSEQVLARARRDADYRYVGKRRKDHALTQEELSQLMVREAKQGKKVLRLKGGDPFIFGRGGEELEELANNQIPFHIVPGITAASGCATYAGIPLTHRDYSQSVRFVTGHPKDGEIKLAWQEFAHPNQTIVFYMGLAGLKRICENLINHGREPRTPAAIISKGTRPDQLVITGTLEDLYQKAEEAAVKAPTLIIVGEVVKLRDVLSSRA